jgi:5,5'-dehydrodivanillate O-demethylase
MLTQEENDRFSRVGPGTPMGSLLRRYWYPVGCSSLITSKPTRVTVLGEELVLYRGASGAPVLMQLRCAHRNVALDYGRVEGDSIRCPYHGWLYNSGGKCIAQPADSDADSFKDEFSLKSYKTEERSGLNFAYLGPDPAPLLPIYDILRLEGIKQIRSYPIHSNWLQGAENILDVSHFSWLHGYTFPTFGAKRTVYEINRAEYGMQISVGLEGGSTMDTGPYLFPAHNRFAVPDGEGGMLHVLFYRVPTDDYTHENYFVAFRANDGVPAVPDREIPAVRLETKVGEYLPLESDWWGIDIGDQDRMAMEQQGPISDRTREHLVASDVGIVRMRRMLREAMDAVERGEDPIGVIRDPAKQVVHYDLSMSIATQAQEDTDYNVGLFTQPEPV